jgi:hypothetical protein
MRFEAFTCKFKATHSFFHKFIRFYLLSNLKLMFFYDGITSSLSKIFFAILIHMLLHCSKTDLLMYKYLGFACQMTTFPKSIKI